VLAFQAAEVAAMLGTSTVAVKSTLQRARARLEQVAPSPEDVSEPADPGARALLDAYISAFQNADPAALERVLRSGQRSNGRDAVRELDEALLTPKVVDVYRSVLTARQGARRG